MNKPTVEVRAVERLFAGRPALFEVTITAVDETKVNGITATVKGEEGWVIGSGENQLKARFEAPAEMMFELAGPGVLAAGSVHTYQVRVPLPSTMAPTHHTSPAWSKLVMNVHIDLPWRFDVRCQFEPRVHRLPPERVERVPVAVRSVGPEDGPRIEISLASRRVIAGEELVGTCAVFHMDDAHQREVELSLLPVLQLYGRHTHERRSTASTATLLIPAGAAGRGVPFRLPLSSRLPVSFDATTHQLKWWLIAQTGGSLFRSKVEAAVPLEMLDASALAHAEALVAAPRLGDERIARLFATFALDVGWRGANLEADAEGATAGQFAIEGDHGSCTLRIAYDYRGKAGTYLVSSVSHRSLGLGLAVTPSSSVRHIFFKDVEVEHRAWDRAHHVVARFGDQAIPFLRAVVSVLTPLAAVGTLRQWTDDMLVYEQITSSPTDQELRTIVRELALIASAIEPATTLVRPPPGVVVDETAWSDLARRYLTTPRWGDLSLGGKLEGTSVEISPVWTDEKTIAALRVSYGDPAQAPDELRAKRLSLAQPARDVLGSDLPEPMISLLIGTPLPIEHLKVSDGVASVVLRVDAQHIDADAVRATVELVRACLMALSPVTAPYR